MMDKKIRPKFGSGLFGWKQVSVLIIILIINIAIGLFHASNIIYGYVSDFQVAAIPDTIFTARQEGEILRILIDGQIAYVAYRLDTKDTAGDEYGIAAVYLSDTGLPGLIWRLGVPSLIQNLATDETHLYITTDNNGEFAVYLDQPDGPVLEYLGHPGQTQTKRRYLYWQDGYYTAFSLPNYSSYSLYPSITQYLNMGQYQTGRYGTSGSAAPWLFLGAFNSGVGYPLNYQTSGLQLWPQMNQGIQTWGLPGYNNSLQFNFLQLSTPYISPTSLISLPGQFSFGTSIPSPLGYQMPFGNIISNTWYQPVTWQIPVQSQQTQLTTGTTATRYRSPVPVRLPLENPLQWHVNGEILLSVVDLNGEIISEQNKPLTIEPGLVDYPIRLSKVPADTTTEDLVKYNLRYRFYGDGVTLNGEKSLFDVAEKMEVRIVGPDSLYADQKTAISVHAFVHGQPVSIDNARVSVDVEMGGMVNHVYEGVTDESGFAQVFLDIPADTLGPGKIRAKVSSDLGTETITSDIEVVRLYKILLTTDKPIYQPGQTIHIRTLSLRKPDFTPEADKEIIIECQDPKGNKVYRVAPVSDGFGVASADFSLGSDINLGQYTVRAIRNEDGIETQSEKKVTVERYVLPKFKVDLVTDAEFYSPGDNVQGSVQAKYFFGKPVSQATVTIEASKFDVDFVLFQTITGMTDDEGFLSFDLALPSYFVGLPLEQGEAFVKLDIKVEDTAGHEEAIVRELTVTKDPIHIRVIPESGQIVTGVENIIYLITTDPKGRGLATHNLVNFDGQIMTVDTDSGGLGSFTVTPDAGSDLICHVASQANGQSALVEIDMSDTLGGAKILLRTDNAIYHVGQTMTVDIYTSEIVGRRVFVDIIRDRQTLFTKGADLNNGHGRLFIDLGNDMVGTILVEAYYISQDKETASDVFRDKKIVYVNPAEDIQVTATADKDQYLPGEKARIEFKVTPPQPTALGITIVDEAVYALQENRPGLLKVYFSMEEQIMRPRFWPLIVPFEDAVTCDDPNEEVQEMTEIAFALAEDPPDPGLNESSYPDLVQRMKEKLIKRINEDGDKVAKDLGGLDVYNPYVYEEALNRGQIKNYMDPWGNKYTLQVGYNNVILTSKGPDEILGTLDDLSLTKPYEPVYKYIYYSGPWYAGIGGGSLYGGYTAYSTSGYLAGAADSGGSYTTDTETQAGFFTPTVTPGGEVPGDDQAGETQEPRKIRRDFPETLLWEPSLITDPNGEAFLDTNMPDSITTWRMSTVASTMEGKLGGNTEGIVVFQDFFIDIDLPVALTQNDEISIPVAIYNYLNEPQRVRILMQTDEGNPWFELQDINEKEVDLEPGQVTSVHFRIKALNVGWHELTVFGYGTYMSDAIARRIEVLPDGMEFHINISERLNGHEIQHVLNIPTEAIDGASKILLKVYPGIFSQVVEGLEKLFKVPFG